MSTQAEYLALRDRHVPRGVGNVHRTVIREARGAVMVDLDGRELIDFAGGIGVDNVGHAHPKVVEAVKAQAEKLLHACFHVAMYAPYVDVAARLNALPPGDAPKKTVLLNSGAEAVENAVKIARHATGRPAVIALENGFHGRTLLGMTLTAKVKPYKLGFGPYAPEVYRAPSPYCYRCPLGKRYPSCDVACADALEEVFAGGVAAEQVAAVIAEPVQGEGGFVTPPPEYFARLQAICRKHGILLIIDEIQSGMGRTGTMLAIQHWPGVVPDLVTTAKSLGGGLPLSAVTGTAELMDRVHPGGLGGTYGGNPVAAAAALAVLDLLEKDGLLDQAQALGRKVRERFDALAQRYPMVGEVRGLGPMLALELVTDRALRTPATDATKRLVAWCFERGLVLLSCGHHGNVIRTLMPLVITDAELERGLAILEEGLRVVSDTP
ncbi:MAG: 4-aminobutyrate--2-oxoglutarate transaminase [Anaeromyxobacter sp.]